jgi:imidazolonepropionase-like amidohydrolase
MKLLIVILAIICSNACVSQSTATGKVVFKDVNVVSMESDQVLMNRDVVVENGKVTAITPTENRNYGNAATIVEAKGKYLMPGLAEMHGHVPPIDDLQPMKDVMQLFASYGITTVRGMLGHPKHLELRKMLNDGTIEGPHFITSGPSFSGNSVKTPAEAIAKVREQKKAGYDFLKIHPGLTPEVFNALATTARQVNIPFAGHVSYHVGVWKAIEARQQTIDHLDAFVEGLVPGIENMKEDEVGFFGMYVADKADTSKIPALMAALKKNNVWVVPTQALAERWMTPHRNAESFRNEPEMKYMDAKTLDNWVQAKQNLSSDEKFDSAKVASYINLRRKLIFECNRTGVGLLLGCDAPQVFNVPGISTHYELQYLVDAGLTPYEALKTGTINVGKFLGTNAGLIKTGATSDLILVSGNPLQNISNTRNIEGVLLGKKWMPREHLEAVRKNLEKSAPQSTAFLPK